MFTIVILVLIAIIVVAIIDLYSKYESLNKKNNTIRHTNRYGEPRFKETNDV